MRDTFGRVIGGSVATDELTIGPAQNRRRRCPWCNPRKPATNVGMADGVVMTTGCEWHMRKWLRDTLAKRRAGAFRRLETL